MVQENSVSVLLFWVLLPSFINACPIWGEKFDQVCNEVNVD